MKTLYFDCFSGISGDMTLAALIDLGIDIEQFKTELDKLELEGYEIIISKKTKNGVVGTDVNVILHEHEHVHEEPSCQKSQEKPGNGHVHEHAHQAESCHEHEHESGHEHEHNPEHHEHEHGYKHEHKHEHEHEHEQKHQHNNQNSHDHNARNLIDITNLINKSSIKAGAKQFAIEVFAEIAAAEAKVHGKNINEVHFHEVGAVDSIVDIVGVAICLDMLGIERIYSSALHEGTGFIKCQHGMLPVPVPAVMEMLSGSNIPIITEDVNTELVTPTGIGIIKCLAHGFGKMPQMAIEKTGYGMGKRETGKFNALRIIMGTQTAEETALDEIAVLETNIDDMSAELLGYTMEKLYENGALDVFYTPIYMKKNRPSVLLTVLAKPQDEEKLADIMFMETTTLGIRRSRSQRYCMNREVKSVSTKYGDVRVKIATRKDCRKLAPEYEDCRMLAKKTGLPAAEIYAAAYEAAREMI